LLFNEFIYISVLREYLSLEFDINNNENEERLYEDFVLLCLLLGNDYIPGVLTLDPFSQIFQIIIQAYKNTLEKTKSFLTENGTINFEKFHILINELKNYESKYIELKYSFLKFYKNQQSNCKKNNCSLKELFMCTINGCNNM
jgi:5'-3' exoribonuclease 1